MYVKNNLNRIISYSEVGGGGKNVLLESQRFAETAEIKMFNPNFNKVYDKLNKLEHFR